MSQKLPTHGFKWLHENKLPIEYVTNLLNRRTTNHGYIFEVDLEYPKKLRKLHNDYPLSPEKIKYENVEKLVGTFYPKYNYVIHYKNLKQYLNLGLKLKKVRGGIPFFSI